MLNKFADELRQQREKAGLSLQQMATKTRIDIKFLEAIDQGNFAFLPDLYVKAFLKQYAKTIGLDENITLKKFEAAREGNEFDPQPPAPIEENIKAEVPKVEAPKTETPAVIVKAAPPVKSYVDEHRSVEDETKNNSRLMIFGLGGIVLIIIAALLYFFVFSKSDEIIVEETPIDEVIEQSNQRYVEEEEPVEQITSDSTMVPFSSDSLYLTFNAKETSWVFVVLDNNRTKEFTLSPNSKFSVTAQREFKATVGNSGGLTLHVNNQPLDFTGRVGSVRHFKLDKTGIVYLNAPPKLER